MRHMLAVHHGRSVSGAFVADRIFCHHAHVAIQLLSFPSLGNSYSMYEVAPRLRGAVGSKRYDSMRWARRLKYFEGCLLFVCLFVRLFLYLCINVATAVSELGLHQATTREHNTTTRATERSAWNRQETRQSAVNSQHILRVW